MTRPKRDPRAAGAILQEALRGLSLEGGDAWGLQSIAARWPEIIGPERAALCSVSGLADGVLTLSTQSYAVRTELTFSAAQVLKRLRETPGLPPVKRIVFSRN